jgi:hypothetical protein
MLSSDDLSNSSPSPWYKRLLSLKTTAWHTVNGDDYLGRGHVDGGLEEKLQDYLHSKVLQSFTLIERY